MFADRYRAAFASLGITLQPKHGLNAQALTSIKLEGLRLPLALEEYLLVAGCEPTLNHSFNRLLAPEDIFVEAGRIVFMEENQRVVYWGVRGDTDDPNPVVEQGVNAEHQPLEWHSELTDCATFLEVMLYWQASFGGGLPYCASSEVPSEVQQQLERDFRYVGRADQLHAYARDGCALTFLKWEGDEWRLFGGFKTKKVQNAVGRELGVDWEEY